MEAGRMVFPTRLESALVRLPRGPRTIGIDTCVPGAQVRSLNRLETGALPPGYSSNDRRLLFAEPLA